MIKLILTVDYEIFGNGDGCVQRCLIDPAEKLMNTCESVGTRLTFFVDYCEYKAFREAEDAGILPDGYLPATWIEAQLKEALSRGHDVQLHLHPQWMDYEYVSPERWKVNLDYWRLPKVPGGYGSAKEPKSLVGLFAMGRKTFEKLLKPVQPEYTCRAFRAGARCIQPEVEVLRAMQATGMRYDSTVAPGIKKNNGLTVFDFTGTSALMPYWRVGSRIDQPSAHGPIMEIPTYTTRINFLYRFIFKLGRLKAQRPPGCRVEANSNDLHEAPVRRLVALSREVQPKVQILDICQQSAPKMSYFIRKACRQYEEFSAAKTTLPLVTAGHPKTFHHSSQLRKFLLWVQQQRFIRLDQRTEKSIWWMDPDDLVAENSNGS